MSQKKVDYYKQAKANRKREEKKKNLRKAFDYTILGLIALAIVVWIGWSKQPRAVAEVDYSAVNDYVQSLNTAEQMKRRKWRDGSIVERFLHFFYALCGEWSIKRSTFHHKMNEKREKI